MNHAPQPQQPTDLEALESLTLKALEASGPDRMHQETRACYAQLKARLEKLADLEKEPDQ